MPASISENKWDRHYITMTYHIAALSKDESTHVGAVIVGPDNELRASGYNGLPRGLLDSVERYQDKAFKYQAINHAEENAIIHCARTGVATKGCKIYSNWLPCARCAKMIIQAGIIEVVYHQDFPGHSAKAPEIWQESMAISRSMLKEAGVKVTSFQGKLIPLMGKYNGEEFSLYD